ncbi:MAG: ferritin-like domain-containing protein [Odoribacter sp.]
MADECLRGVVKISRYCYKNVALQVAAEIGDDGTQDVFSSYISEQEKLLWMLNAYLN